MLKLLGPSVPIERSFFGVPRISAIIVGFWPRRRLHWLLVPLFLLNSFAVALGAFGETIYGLMNLEQLVDAMEAFCPSITKTICLLKMWMFFIYRQRWYDIIQRMRGMLTKDRTSAHQTIAQNLSSLANILSFVLLVSGTTTNIFFNLLPVASATISAFSLPQIFSDYPLYPMTYGVLTLSGCMTVFTFSAVDGFFVCACMHTSSLFRMLQHDIRNVFTVHRRMDHMTTHQNAQIRRQLAVLIVRHNAIIDLCSDFASQFTLIILMHFLSAALVLCLSILDLMLNSASVSVIIYVFYSVAASTQLFLYCIGGHYVSDSSLAIAATLYEVEWYKCDVATRKMILMMLLRSQKAITVAVPFFTPSLAAFSSIISTAGSYIALLNTFL